MYGKDAFENLHIEQIITGYRMKVKITTTLDQDKTDESFECGLEFAFFLYFFD